VHYRVSPRGRARIPRPGLLGLQHWTFEWTVSGQKMPMRFWNRPLHAMTDSFTSAGFRISVISALRVKI